MAEQAGPNWALQSLVSRILEKLTEATEEYTNAKDNLNQALAEMNMRRRRFEQCVGEVLGDDADRRAGNSRVKKEQTHG